MIIEHKSKSDIISLLISANDTDNGTASLIILLIKCSASSLTVFKLVVYRFLDKKPDAFMYLGSYFII